MALRPPPPCTRLLLLLQPRKDTAFSGPARKLRIFSTSAPYATRHSTEPLHWRGRDTAETLHYMTPCSTHAYRVGTWRRHVRPILGQGQCPHHTAPNRGQGQCPHHTAPNRGQGQCPHYTAPNRGQGQCPHYSAQCRWQVRSEAIAFNTVHHISGVT